MYILFAKIINKNRNYKKFHIFHLKSVQYKKYIVLYVFSIKVQMYVCISFYEFIRLKLIALKIDI